MDLENKQNQDWEARILCNNGDFKKHKTRNYLMNEKTIPHVRFARHLGCDKDSAETEETSSRIQTINVISSEVVEPAGLDLRCQSSLSQCVSVISCNSTHRLKSALKSQASRREKYVKTPTLDTNNAGLQSCRTEKDISTSKLPELDKKPRPSSKAHDRQDSKKGTRAQKYSCFRGPTGKVPRNSTANRVSVAGKSVEGTLHGVHCLRPFLPLLTLTQYSDVDSAVIEVVREYNDTSQGAINTVQSYL